MPVSALEPVNAQAAAEMLADAAAERHTVVVEGSGTKITVVDRAKTQAMSTRLLTTGLAHYAGDLVATVPAGITLRDANCALARERQWIPLDPRFPDSATIGGIVATNDSGPRRHQHGAPRDMILGVEVALPSGRVAHAGGRVVKNVAGYDLARLLCGSHGSLSLITSATFKLAPVPPASRTVVARFERLQDAAIAALALSTSPVTPSAVDLLAPAPRLLVRFETTVGSAEQMAASTALQLRAAATDTAVVDGDDEASAWREHVDVESGTDGLLISIAILPTHTSAAIDDVEMLAKRLGVSWSLTGRAALGVLRVRTVGELAAQLQFAVALRTAVTTRGGHLQLLSGPESVLLSADRFGPVGSAAAIGFAVKQQFDPLGVLPYPWTRG
jgi:glycolate oxidase FAD binding subunit